MPPPGRTKECSGFSSFWQRSIAASSAVTSASPTRNMPGWNDSGGVASSPPEVEELVLQPPEQRVELARRHRRVRCGGVHGTRQTERRVQLVDATVGLDAAAVLRDALAPDQIGLALVAAARVDAGDPDRHGALSSRA